MTYWQKIRNWFRTESTDRSLRECWRFLVRHAESAALLGFGIALLIGAIASTGVETERYTEGVLRLHVIANSDDTADQTVKLLVRDAVIEETTRLLIDAQSKEDAMRQMAAHLPDLTLAADKALSANGFSYRANVRLCKSTFPNRQYDRQTLPAGEYDAIRVELGQAQGQNWWCVLFPQLCLPAATEEQPTTEGSCQWRFFFWEWLQKLFAGAL